MRTSKVICVSNPNSVLIVSQSLNHVDDNFDDNCNDDDNFDVFVEVGDSDIVPVVIRIE